MTTLSPRSSTRSATQPTRGQDRDEEGAGRPLNARLLLRVDGIFEAVLGVLLILRFAAGLAGAAALPYPATQPVVVIFGLLLLPLLPTLWWLSRAPRRRLVMALAAANGAGALIFVLWVLIWHGAFTATGAALVLIVAAVLGALAALQARSAVLMV